jgi:hypothetical protein
VESSVPVNKEAAMAKVVVVTLRDGDRTVTVPDAVVGREEGDWLVVYGDQGRTIARFRLQDLKSWWSEDAAAKS